MAAGAGLALDPIVDMLCSAGKEGGVPGWRPGPARECSSDTEIELVLEDSSSSASCTSSLLSAGRASSDAASSLGAWQQACQRDFHTATTADGWRLHLTHMYDPAAAAAGERAAHPVLLVPGLASSAKHTFDLQPEHSLANTLAARGYDVWMADLRGNGRSQKPRLFDRSTWWTVDDHLAKDVPAVLEYVLAHTGAPQLHWVGHSMGGMLAVGLLSARSQLAGRLRSITLVGSGCFGAGSWHSLLRPLITRLTRHGFPAGLLCGVVGALAGSPASLWLLEALFYVPRNMPAGAAPALMRRCFAFIPVGVVDQFLGTLNSPAGLSSVDGSFRYADPDALADAALPVLGVTGSWDLFCPPAGGARTVAMFGSDAKQFVTVGPRGSGAGRHYGHFDVLCGRHAPAEVFPHILEHLEAHDGPMQMEVLPPARVVAEQAEQLREAAQQPPPPMPVEQAQAGALQPPAPQQH